MSQFTVAVSDDSELLHACLPLSFNSLYFGDAEVLPTSMPHRRLPPCVHALFWTRANRVLQMWAVGQALEGAKESIWILDWWLSPELYLRRPPSTNEQYRLDRVLQRAAERGVKVNIIVYKEVTQVLTRKFGSNLTDYIHSFLPSHADSMTSRLVKLGLHATTASLSHVEKEYPLIDPAVTVSSAHTKHSLEALHPNIAVFRHPGE